jgi:hypothetical protein
MPRNKTEEDTTAEALERFAGTPDPRLRQIMLGLVKHLHAFVKEVELTEAEWLASRSLPTPAVCFGTSGMNSSVSRIRSSCRWWLI